MLAFLSELLIDCIIFFKVLVASLPVCIAEDRVEYFAKVDPEVNKPVFRAQTCLDLHDFVLILTTGAESL